MHWEHANHNNQAPMRIAFAPSARLAGRIIATLNTTEATPVGARSSTAAHVNDPVAQLDIHDNERAVATMWEQALSRSAPYLSSTGSGMSSAKGSAKRHCWTCVSVVWVEAPTNVGGDNGCYTCTDS